MAKAQVGKDKWRRLLRRGFTATKEQFERSSQLRANLMRLMVENQDNGEAATFFAQMIAQLDLITEQIFEHQAVYQGLWEISMGEVPPEAKDDT